MDGDVMKVAGATLAVPVAALGVAPVVYQAGKALAEVSRGRATNRFLDGFADWARQAGFHDVFVPVFAGLAMLAVVVLHEWTGGRATRVIAIRGSGGVPGAGWRLFAAVAAAAAGLLAGGVVLLAGGAGVAEDGGLARLAVALAGAVGAAFLTEWFFRGVLFGQLERVMPGLAVAGVTAVAFAGMRLLLWPPVDGFEFECPESWRLGWEMCGLLAARLLEPGCFVAVVLPVFGWGLLLGLVRLRTGGIRTPFCLHAGWLCVDRMFAMGAGFTATQLAWVCWCALAAAVMVWVWMNRRQSHGD